MTRARLPLALVAALALSGCHGVQAQWVHARTAVDASRGVLEVLGGDTIADHIPDSARADYDTAIATGRETMDLGSSLVDAWEAEEAAPQAWHEWTERALDWCDRILGILKGAGVDVPEEVSLALGGLRVLLPIVSAAVGAT